MVASSFRVAGLHPVNPLPGASPGARDRGPHQQWDPPHFGLLHHGQSLTKAFLLSEVVTRGDAEHSASHGVLGRPAYEAVLRTAEFENVPLRVLSRDLIKA